MGLSSVVAGTAVDPSARAEKLDLASPA